jgi:hypothetical protein
METPINRYPVTEDGELDVVALCNSVGESLVQVSSIVGSADPLPEEIDLTEQHLEDKRTLVPRLPARYVRDEVTGELVPENDETIYDSIRDALGRLNRLNRRNEGEW